MGMLCDSCSGNGGECCPKGMINILECIYMHQFRSSFLVFQPRMESSEPVIQAIEQRQAQLSHSDHVREV